MGLPDHQPPSGLWKGRVWKGGPAGWWLPVDGDLQISGHAFSLPTDAQKRRAGRAGLRGMCTHP